MEDAETMGVPQGVSVFQSMMGRSLWITTVISVAVPLFCSERLWTLGTIQMRARMKVERKLIPNMGFYFCGTECYNLPPPLPPSPMEIMGINCQPLIHVHESPFSSMLYLTTRYGVRGIGLFIVVLTRKSTTLPCNPCFTLTTTPLPPTYLPPQATLQHYFLVYFLLTVCSCKILWDVVWNVLQFEK